MGGDGSTSVDDLTGPLRGPHLRESVLGGARHPRAVLCSWSAPCDNRFQATNEAGSVWPHFRWSAPCAGKAHAGVGDRRGPHAAFSARLLRSDRRFATTGSRLSSSSVRDGRSMATRQVTVAQGDRALLTALASFHSNPSEPEFDPGYRWTCRRRKRCLCFSTGCIRRPPAMRGTRRRGSTPRPRWNADRRTDDVPGRRTASGTAFALDAPAAKASPTVRRCTTRCSLTRVITSARHGSSLQSSTRRLHVGRRGQPGPPHPAAPSGPLRRMASLHTRDSCHRRTPRARPRSHSRCGRARRRQHRPGSAGPAHLRHDAERGRSRCSTMTSSI